MMDAQGDFHEILTHRPLFRKTKPSDVEKKIARIIQQNPHPNIVDVYHVCDEYIDMELVDVSSSRYNKQDIGRAHAYFLKHGIAYMDWKEDNYGSDKHGITKVFDFDSAGMFNRQKDEWTIRPPDYWSLGKAIQADMSTPTEIDSFTFDHREEIWG
jgi:hypothetical protein